MKIITRRALSSDCASCHNFNKFKPASLFNHGKTEFPLVGAHKTVDCASCHKVEMRNGKEYQKFAVASFKNCSSCHNDVHKGAFGNQCKACHNEESFHKIVAGQGFNHSITGFTLVGKHQNSIAVNATKRVLAWEVILKNSNQKMSMIVALAMMTCTKANLATSVWIVTTRIHLNPVKHPSWTTLITILPVLPYWVNTSKWIVALVTSKTSLQPWHMISAWTVTKIITKGF